MQRPDRFQRFPCILHNMTGNGLWSPDADIPVRTAAGRVVRSRTAQEDRSGAVVEKRSQLGPNVFEAQGRLRENTATGLILPGLPRNPSFRCPYTPVSLSSPAPQL